MCGHSYCSNCLKRLKTCPICLKLICFNPVKNFAVLNIAEKLGIPSCYKSRDDATINLIQPSNYGFRVATNYGFPTAEQIAATGLFEID